MSHILGGIPAPNPTFPEPIKSVTGNNNVVVKNSDNSASQTLPLNLGTIELNKIGTYQDYIYKNNGNWYKKEVIGKAIVTGAINWAVSNTGTSNWYYVGNIASEIMTPANPLGSCLSNYFKNASIGNSDTNKGFMLLSNTTNTCNMRIRTETEDTPTNFKAWVNDHNIIVYAPLLNATDIEITDTQLISQLEAIDNMYSYNGTTIITSTYEEGNAQMIISGSALKGE